MNDTNTSKGSKQSEKPGFFKKLIDKLDSKMKETADEKAKSDSCCGPGDKGKGGKCC